MLGRRAHGRVILPSRGVDGGLQLGLQLVHAARVRVEATAVCVLRRRGRSRREAQPREQLAADPRGAIDGWQLDGLLDGGLQPAKEECGRGREATRECMRVMGRGGALGLQGRKSAGRGDRLYFRGRFFQRIRK